MDRPPRLPEISLEDDFAKLQAENAKLKEILRAILKGMPIATIDNLCLFVKFKEKLEKEFGKDFTEQALKGSEAEGKDVKRED